MVGIEALLGILGLGATGGGYLAKKDRDQDQNIDENAERIDELDTSFAQLTTRLFGHPDDDSDDGVISARGERVEEHAENIDSLEDRVEDIQDQAEDNGEAIQSLDDQVTEHADQTRKALRRIEDQLDDVELVPPDDRDDFLRGDD